MKIDGLYVRIEHDSTCNTIFFMEAYYLLYRYKSKKYVFSIPKVFSCFIQVDDYILIKALRARPRDNDDNICLTFIYYGKLNCFVPEHIKIKYFHIVIQ